MPCDVTVGQSWGFSVKMHTSVQDRAFAHSNTGSRPWKNLAGFNSREPMEKTLASFWLQTGRNARQTRCKTVSWRRSLSCHVGTGDH